MANENEGQSTDTVSREAHEREIRKNATLQEQLDKATSALAGVSKRDKARAILREKGVADPDAAADLASPFLDTVEDNPEAITEALSHDRFKVLMTVTATTDEPGTGDGDDDGDTNFASEPAAGGFGGPSPAGSGGKPVESKQKLSPEDVKTLIAKNDEAALKDAYAKGLIDEPSRPWH